MPLAFDRGRKFVRNRIKCLFVAKLIILFWFEQLVKKSSVRIGPLESRITRRSCFDRANWPHPGLMKKKWFSVLLTSDISVSIVDLSFKEFSLKRFILKNNSTEKTLSTKRFVWQIKSLFWAENSLFRIIWKSRAIFAGLNRFSQSFSASRCGRI